MATVQGKRVLVRVDFNVPVKDGVILDDTRLRAVVPTVKGLQEKGARVILLTHFGRPKGADLDSSTAFLCAPLAQILDCPVAFAPKGVSPETLALTKELEDGQILLVENLRFDKGEESNDPTFARALADLGDLYVNDAFSVSHRAHASVVGITDFLPSFAGTTLMQEVAALTKALAHPDRPLTALVAGSKISTKLALLENLLDKVDFLMLGGGIANTFLAAQGHHLQDSLVETQMIPTAQRILESAPSHNCKIILPCDGVVSKTLENPIPCTTSLNAIEPGEKIFDLGPASLEAFTQILKASKTLVWNGPVGVFEVPPFHEGTCLLAKRAAYLTKSGALFSLAGGGETVAALTQAGAAQDFSYVSLAGGAFLEFLEGKTLPGLVPLTAPAD